MLDAARQQIRINQLLIKIIKRQKEMILDKNNIAISLVRLM
jgi:hypothetical protein